MSPRPAAVVGVLAERVAWAAALALLWLAGAGPLLASGSQSQPEGPLRVAQIRVHGNHTTPDEDVRRLAGLSEGDTLPAGGVAEVAARLEASGRFRRVEVRVRQRSIEDASDVALIVIVEEHPVPSAAPMSAPARWLRNTGAGVMWLPVLEYEDAYGVTFGARVTLADALGPRTRVSVPLTWGGTRRAALEVEARPAGWRGATLLGGVALWQREHPHWETAERRTEAWAGSVVPVAGRLRAEPRVTWAAVRFGGVDRDLVIAGGDLVLDTRVNPALPRNAVYLRGGVHAVREEGRATYRRTRADLRAYVGMWGSAVLAVRGQVEDASAPQPAYLQPWLGGVRSVRGLSPGRFAGDRLVAASAEVRVPFSSPLSAGTLGVAAFVDAGGVGAHGTPLSAIEFERSAGAGLFLALPVFSVNLDVAHAVGRGTRLHVSTGVRF